MIINWLTTQAQQFLAARNVELDELNVGFDFALSPEMMNLLYAQNDERMTETNQPTEDVTTVTQFALDEHELALA
jgi:hypothetical protein